jgi:hypothetical protein
MTMSESTALERINRMTDMTTRNNGKGTRKPPPVEHQFKPGNPGRPKGSRNKLGEDFIQALAADFERHGAETIERVRVQSPAAYLKVVASLLPKDVNLKVNNLDSLTDEQLLARLRRLTVKVAPLLAKAAEDANDELEPAASRH